MASLRFRAGGWDLRFRDRAGRERTERFTGDTNKRPPEAALDRNASLEREPRHKHSVLDKAAKWAALDRRRISWLTSRHTAVFLMFDAGLANFDVQRRLGNHSPVVTAEVYTHLMRECYEEGRVLRMENYMRWASV